MKINIGSRNPNKVDAVRDILDDYLIFREAEVEGINVETGVRNQPMSLQETVLGATSRAKNAFLECDYSIGLESGIIEVPETKSGFMNVAVCCIYNGKDVAIGVSSMFEIPSSAMIYIKNGDELQTAVNKAGFTTDKKIGSNGGIISIFSDGYIHRKDLSAQAVRSAMIHLQHPEIFEYGT
ncbi:inosine/xanthosine triphosphatase [Patescibacteria group bacterium]|nr:inosine/xanthosine triphosphatase [Patescibacteria group bacterium]